MCTRKLFGLAVLGVALATLLASSPAAAKKESNAPYASCKLVGTGVEQRASGEALLYRTYLSSDVVWSWSGTVDSITVTARRLTPGETYSVGSESGTIASAVADERGYISFVLGPFWEPLWGPVGLSVANANGETVLAGTLVVN